MALRLITCVAFVLPLWAFADYTNTGIQIVCLPNENEFRFNAETLGDEPAMWAAAPKGAREQFLRDAKERGLYLETEFRVACKLGANEFVVSGQMFEPSERGECGADPGGYVGVSMDGLPILNYATFANYCFPSLWSASVHQLTQGTTMKLCGYGRFGKGQSDEKCKTFTLPARRATDAEPIHQGDVEGMVGG